MINLNRCRKIIAILIVLFSSTLLFSEEKKVITVLEFSVNNVSENDMISITSFLAAALFDTGKYRVIDASQRNAILEELSFSASGCVDESCQLEIGKLLSAEMIVVGNIGLLGDRYMLSAKILETETSDTVSIAKGIYADLNELVDKMPQFASELAGAEYAEEAEEEEPPPEVGPVVEEEPQEVPETVLQPADTEKASTGSSRRIRKIAGLSCMAGGVLVSALGGYLVVDAVGFYQNDLAQAEDLYAAPGSETYPGDWSTATQEERDAYFDELYNDLANKSDESNGKFLTAAGIAAGGLVLLGTGIFLYFFPGKVETSANSTEVSLNVLPGIRRTSFNIQLSF